MSTFDYEVVHHLGLDGLTGTATGPGLQWAAGALRTAAPSGPRR